jgi:hypothetical protein
MTDLYDGGATTAPDDLIDDDATYFRTRAAWHRARASVATDSPTRNLHRKFATLYEARSLF